MKLVLPSELDFLLREVARSAGIEATRFRNAEGHWQLTASDRDSLMDAVSNEFAHSGLDETDEPNPRGLALENILDRLNATKSMS